MDSIIVHGMECPFLSKGDEFYVKKEGDMSLHTKLRGCELAPEDVEDPWKSEDQFVDDIEPYCPIEECKVEDPWKSEDQFVDDIEPYCPIEECKEDFSNGIEPAGLCYCGKCFGPIRSRDKYCPNCGILIKRDEEG